MPSRLGIRPVPPERRPAGFPSGHLAKSGFGGTEYLLPGLITEGRKRGLPYPRIAALVSWNPAQRYGLYSKGTIDVGYDADLVLVDPDRSWVVSDRVARRGEATVATLPESFPR